MADTEDDFPALPSPTLTAGSLTGRQAVKLPFSHEEPIQQPFESFSEPPTLLWRPAAEQQHKVVSLSPSRAENGSPSSVLNVTNEDGILSQFMIFQCWAAIAYPRDAQARNELLVTLKADLGAQIRETLQSNKDKMLMSALIGQWIEPHGGFPALLQASGKDTVLNRMSQHWWPGSVAGDVLQWIVRLHYWSPPASVNKAVFLEERYLEHARDLEGRHGPSSKRSILAAWQHYKPVVHLWAAFRLWQFYYGDSTGHGPDKPGPDWFSPFLSKGLPGFLTYAEIFRRIGTAIYAHGQSGPVLDPTETWQLPQNFQLLNLLLPIPSLEDWTIETLKGYRA